jgi:DNA adenine methylase
MPSFIRWAGSKRALLPRLRRYWSTDFSRYIEPFAGSSCFFFDLSPEAAVLGDLNKELIDTYRVVKLEVEKVIEALRRLPRSKKSYYAIRKIDPLTLPGPDAAARFIYLNSYCFNGLYRTNSSGVFNVPYHPPSGYVRISAERLREASRRLAVADIVNADFEHTLSFAKRGDFVYLDPPYAVKSRRVFSEYFPGSFGGADLARFAKSLDDLDARGVAFLVSYGDCAESREMLRKWNSKRVSTRRNIAGFCGHRRKGFELLATNLNEAYG